MSEVKKNEITVRLKGLSLFANIGIAEAYLKSIGIDVVVANEYVDKRADLYQKIYPDCEMICGDITADQTANKILAAAKKHHIDILMATPPCQGMSTAGKQREFEDVNRTFKSQAKIVESKRIWHD